MPDRAHDLNDSGALTRRWVEILNRCEAAEGALRDDVAPRELALAITDVVIAANVGAESAERRGAELPDLRSRAHDLQSLIAPFASRIEDGRDRGQVQLALRDIAGMARALLGER